MRRRTLYLLLLAFVWIRGSFAQSTPAQVAVILNQQIYQPEVVSYLLQTYLTASAASLPSPKSPGEWTAEAGRIRKHLLKDVVFHGWPEEWVDSAPKFEDAGAIPSDKGFTRRKLRYEVVPGFYSTAILYEPANLRGKAPAILNVTGHVGPEGKSVEYEQKRCINFALQGIIALNLEWVGQGELSAQENQHFYGGHLDLVGANSVGLFYLEMRRGLDYLARLPQVDGNRLGMTGLSGGGWQTMFLSALDERIKVAVPVAGYDTLVDWIPRLPRAAGDNEQAGTDVFQGQEYAVLTAMRAPRPTLLILNAEDDCCFRAGIVKPYAYDAIKPFFSLFGKPDDFQFHENLDPSTHNYGLDNRQQAYEFFTRNFKLPVITQEVPVGSEIKSYDELQVGLPKDNLTILGLAREIADRTARQSHLSEESGRIDNARILLKQVVRYKPLGVSRAEAVSTTKDKGVESLGYRFRLENNLPATGIWLKAIAAPEAAPISILLDDKGRKFATPGVANRINRGEQVLAVDLLFTGDSSTEGIPVAWAYPEMLAAEGDRPLGLEVAQLLAITHWMERRAGTHEVRLESRGIRNQVVALIAAAIEPGLFSEVVINEGMQSLGHLLTAPVHYEDAADLFCLDLFKDFDLEEIAAISRPSVVTYDQSRATPQK